MLAFPALMFREAIAAELAVESANQVESVTLSVRSERYDHLPFRMDGSSREGRFVPRSLHLQRNRVFPVQEAIRILRLQGKHLPRS